eukprot:g5057.t1
MGKRKGLSFDEKRSRLLSIIRGESPIGMTVWNLKELEKVGSKAGIVMQSIKEVLQSLVDDSLVNQDKVGSQNIFWSFPSEVTQRKLSKIKRLEKELANCLEAKERADVEMDVLRKVRVESEQRAAMLKELRLLKHRKAANEEALKSTRKNDPKVLEELGIKVNIAKESVNRWTDNIWQVKSFVVKKFGKTAKEMDAYLGIPVDFDYVE